MLLWEEMSRREAWDRNYENNIPGTEEEKSFMEKQKAEDDRLRRDWDAKFKLHSQGTTTMSKAYPTHLK